MRTILLSVCFAVLTVFTIEALREPAYLPTHPLDTRIGDKDPFFIEKNSFIDSIQPTWTGSYSLHKWSSDGYIDTIYANMSTLVDFYSKENNKLIRRDFYVGPVETKSFSSTEFYNYDNQGRRTTHTMTHYSHGEDGSLTKKDTVIFDYDFSMVVYTDSGYIFNDIEYIFDKQDRLIRIKKRAYESHHHLNVDYTYFDENKGYSKLLYGILNPPASESRTKEEYYFDDKGLLINSRTYMQYYADTEWSEWELTQDWHDSYTFYDDITSNGLTTAESIHQIYGVEGGISIRTGQPEKVSIYTINGQLLRRNVVNDYLKVDLPKGLYIVTAGKEAYKVVVR